MKNLLFLLLFISTLIHAQDTCTGIEKREIFQANRIGATIYPNGYRFYDEDGYFKAPYTSTASASSIFASNTWLSAYRDGQLKVAAQGYASETHYDFQVGPLLEGSIPSDSACLQFNRVWSMKRADIEKHIEDFESDGVIDDPIASVFGWPAEGNAYFKSVNGFALPSPHRGEWANFHDDNSNGIYEPEAGEYPCIFLNEIPYLPERMMWMVYNDQGVHLESLGEPLGVEIQLTVYGFNCDDNPVLNNAMFTSYKVINQHDQTLDSVYFGLWTDYDLGCAHDDYIGCDTSRNTEFVYNMDSDDGDEPEYGCSSNAATYRALPPAQSFTYLSHSMSGFTNASDVDTTSTLVFHNMLKGLWPDGTAISIHGDGYNPGGGYPETKFIFSGDPLDPLAWSQVSTNAPSSDQRVVSSISLGQLQPYQQVRIDGVYIFHQDSSLGNIEHVGLMYNQVDALRSMVANGSLTCTPFPDCDEEDCVWPGDFNHNGKADHYDLLSWGVANDQHGAARNGIIDWDGHYADAWNLNMPDNLNAKYADGNGDGQVNPTDLDRNIEYFTFTNAGYEVESDFTPGPHLFMTANPTIESGVIRNFKIISGQSIPNVLGLAFELDYDTSLLAYQRFFMICPADSNYNMLIEDGSGEKSYGQIVTSTYNAYNGYSFVITDHLPITVDSGFTFLRSVSTTGFKIRPDVDPDDIPDSTIIRLKNLIALDAQGNDLHIGSEQLVVYKEGFVGIHDPAGTKTVVYPNPTDGFLHIETAIESEAQLFSLHGQLARHLSRNELERPVDVSALPPGIYFLRILATGESIKVIVQ